MGDFHGGRVTYHFSEARSSRLLCSFLLDLARPKGKFEKSAGVDLVVSRKDSDKKVLVKVVGLTKEPAVPLGKSLENLKADIIFVVNNLTKESPNIFIIPVEEAKKIARRTEKKHIAYWIEPYAYKPFRDGWEKLFNQFD